MLALLLAGWLCAPLAPLNPIEQDTLASMNLHVTAGVSSPNGVVSLGPELTVKYELLVVHPFVVRGGVDFKYGRTTSKLFPRGDLFSSTLSIDALYYRGTDHLLGYVGAGAVYSLHDFAPNGVTSDSLMTNEGISDVGMGPASGFRLTMGLRYKRSYSLEISITETNPSFIKYGNGPGGGDSRAFQETRTGSIRVTFGYLFEISRH